MRGDCDIAVIACLCLGKEYHSESIDSELLGFSNYFAHFTTRYIGIPIIILNKIN